MLMISGGPRTDEQWVEAKYYGSYANRYYRLELQFKMHINLSILTPGLIHDHDIPCMHTHFSLPHNEPPGETPHTGVVWRVSRVNPEHNVGQALYAGLRNDGQYRFGTINDGWTNIIDREMSDMPGTKGITMEEIINRNHTIRIDIIGSIYRLYLNEVFYFETIHTDFPNGSIGIRTKKV